MLIASFLIATLLFKIIYHFARVFRFKPILYYSRYVGQNYLDYDYDPVARHDPKLADKNISKRRNLGGEGYDLTSPSVYYGTGYSHGKTTNRQGGVTFGGGGGGGAFSINPQVAITKCTLNTEVKLLLGD